MFSPRPTCSHRLYNKGLQLVRDDNPYKRAQIHISAAVSRTDHKTQSRLMKAEIILFVSNWYVSDLNLLSTSVQCSKLFTT